MLKKLTGGIVSAVLLASSAVSALPAGVMTTVNAADGKFNYADALDKSLFFYEAQQAGPLPEWNRVEWKADSAMSDPVLGGWYDAGDHVKFNLPMSYSASMLAWGLYQYPDGVEKAGLKQTYVNNLEFVLDYLAECDKGTEIIYQVGIGKHDHTWWGPVELLEYGMEDNGHSVEEARACLKSSKGCSAVFGEMAAALAAGAAALDGDIDASKKADYLKHAENIYKIAKTSPSDDVYNKSDAQGFYQSSHFYDELFYAANWLYIATKDDAYLADAKSFMPNLGKMLGEGDTLAYGWAHCWDDNMQGAMLLYAINTNDSSAIAHVKKHCDRWVNGDEAKLIDGGLRWLSNWGCLRYANTAAFIATVAGDTILTSEASKYTEFAEAQVNYALGDNPLKQSYVVGFGDKYPQNPHHRTAHGSWKNDLKIPDKTRHILYGALVGGPNQDGSYNDDRQDFINNEVATDYNAGFTAMLCKMIDKYGGTKDASFPQPEVHDGPEFYVEVLSKGGDASGQTISFKVTNHSAWPARVQDNISFRYYMDLSEVKAAGKNPEDLVIRCDRDQSAMYAAKGYKTAEISKPKQYSGDIYYIEVNLPDGRVVLPISEGQQQCEILLAIVMPDYGSGWDSSNDFSAKDLGKTAKGTDGSAVGVVTPYVPVYVNGKLYYGEEPDGTKADGLGGTGSDTPRPTTTTVTKSITTTTTTATTTVTSKGSTTTMTVTDADTTAATTVTTTATTIVSEVTTTTNGGAASGPNDEPVDGILYGDANCDRNVDMSDVVIIMQSLANPNKYGINGTDKNHLTELGSNQGDVDRAVEGITSNDALFIQEYLLHKRANLFPSVK
ncbi:glycoside hydrolase family 9 protein [Ruminococcus flavefaciens]|uniref:glycoside hydrolase family 9 protein n=1 Tax=Ruminococcus flavefaciens TaxID=1265 RepID=UPI0026EAACEA|nr:glycoside hydrolase family 9 protein [Ruminococcus flavefaciens]